MTGAYINDAAQRADSIRPVENITANSGILHNNTGGHDRVLCGICQLLQDQVYHLAQRGILVLEQLRDAEKERRGLICRELLPRKQEHSNLRQEGAASSRRDGRSIKQSSCGGGSGPEECFEVWMSARGNSVPSWNTDVRSSLIMT